MFKLLQKYAYQMVKNCLSYLHLKNQPPNNFTVFVELDVRLLVVRGRVLNQVYNIVTYTFSKVKKNAIACRHFE